MKEQKIEINFGNSQWEMNRFDYSPEEYPESIIYVPQRSVLKPIQLKGKEIEIYNNITKLSPEKNTTDGRPSVKIMLAQGLFERDYEIILLWIEERDEWVLIWHECWIEGGFMWTDDSYSGPYAIDRFCRDKIFEAYQVSIGTLLPDGGLHPLKLMYPYKQCRFCQYFDTEYCIELIFYGCLKNHFPRTDGKKEYPDLAYKCKDFNIGNSRWSKLSEQTKKKMKYTG